MTKKSPFELNSIQYLRIRDLAFNYEAPDSIQSFEPESETIHFHLDIVKTVSMEQQLIRIVFTIHLRTDADQGKEVICLYSTEHVFKISHFKDLVKATQGLIGIEHRLDDILTALAYSTIRGLLCQKLSGTSFSKFILPVADPADLGSVDSSV